MVSTLRLVFGTANYSASVFRSLYRVFDYAFNEGTLILEVKESKYLYQQKASSWKTYNNDWIFQHICFTLFSNARQFLFNTLKISGKTLTSASEYTLCCQFISDG